MQARAGARGWKLTHILNTHHHLDHTGGNVALKETIRRRGRGPGERTATASPASMSGVDESHQLDVRGAHACACWRFRPTPARTSLSFVDECGVHRRHAVRHGLRPAVRGHARDDVDEPFQAHDVCPTKRASIAAMNIRSTMAASRSRSSRQTLLWCRACATSKRRARRNLPTIPSTSRPGEEDQSVPAARLGGNPPLA